MMRSMLAIVAALVGFASTVHAATKPSFRVEPASVSETGLLVPIRIDKSAVASSYSKVSVRTVDGTAKAGVDYTPISTTVTFSNSGLWWSVPVAVIARSGYQGNRSFTVHIAAVRNATIAQADAVVTILESEQPPAPTQACPDGSVILATAVCPVAPPPPPSPIAAWIPAPLTIGGYACSKWQAGPCGSGLVYRITGATMSADAVPVQQYTAVFYQDVSGQFPRGDSFAIGFIGYWAASDLIGIAPAP